MQTALVCDAAFVNCICLQALFASCICLQAALVCDAAFVCYAVCCAACVCSAANCTYLQPCICLQASVQTNAASQANAVFKHMQRRKLMQCSNTCSVANKNRTPQSIHCDSQRVPEIQICHALGSVLLLVTRIARPTLMREAGRETDKSWATALRTKSHFDRWHTCKRNQFDR